MSEYDFKGALASVEQHGVMLSTETTDTIKAALRVAKRMQSGHVSNAMIWAVKDNYAGDVAVFHAMTAQLMKEVKDE